MKKLLYILGAIFIFTGCSISSSTETKELSSLYEKILEKGEIRIGYISYPPSYIVDPEGNHSGIFHEVLQKVGENLGVKLVYEKEVTWDGMIQDLKNDKIDMVATGIWPTSQRGKHVDFTTPLFFSVVKAYTYEDNDSFDGNLDAVNSRAVKIATIDGEMTSIIAEMDFPNAERIDVPQIAGVTQTLMEVKARKADITFVEPAIALEFQEKNPNSIKEVKNIPPLRVFPNSMMIPKGENELRTTLNIAIEELINSGFLDKVIDKYEKFPDSYSRIASPYKDE